MNVYEGVISARGLRFAIVVSRFNSFITNKLLDGALDALKRHRALEKNISVVWVPGAFEIPLTAKKLSETGNFDAIICLGAVIRGATTHYDYVCNEVSKGVAQVGLQSGVPTIFGIVTTENIQQAIERAGTKSGNKGFDAAVSAMEMANLFKDLSSNGESVKPRRRRRKSADATETVEA